MAARVLAFVTAADLRRRARKPGAPLAVRQRALQLRAGEAVAAAALLECSLAGGPGVTRSDLAAAWRVLEAYCLYAGRQPWKVRQVETAETRRAAALWGGLYDLGNIIVGTRIGRTKNPISCPAKPGA
jgi:hypothetical protein